MNKYTNITFKVVNGTKYKTYHLNNERKTTITVQDEYYDFNLGKMVKVNVDAFEKA